VWSWADDSGKGFSQDIYKDYDPQICLKLETSLAKGEQSFDLGNGRHTVVSSVFLLYTHSPPHKIHTMLCTYLTWSGV
jgi:hypothetical protein